MSLYSANHPKTFWKLLLAEEPEPSVWDEAIQGAAALLPPRVTMHGNRIDPILEAALGEGQFGDRRWRLGLWTRLYYTFKPLVTRGAARRLRRLHHVLTSERYQLDWPVERRYADFVRAVAAGVLERSGLKSASFIHFWPNRARFGLVLTHDVETADGQANVLRVAELEQGMGYRSAFNFVPERYSLDHGLLTELRARGFEVGVHDLRHDGKLFASRSGFERHARRINEHLRRLGASGFRAGFLHRNAEWMQRLDINYDMTFFDTDPFEPMPGGSMTLWPFQIGKFLEIPTTLVQDHTLTQILQERSARLWLSKISYLADQCGLVAVNAHPDYMVSQDTWKVYRQLLEVLALRHDYWAALPAAVFDWWTRRAQALSLQELEGGAAARLEIVRPSVDGVPRDVRIELEGQESVSSRRVRAVLPHTADA